MRPKSMRSLLDWILHGRHHYPSHISKNVESSQDELMGMTATIVPSNQEGNSLFMGLNETFESPPGSDSEPIPFEHETENYTATGSQVLRKDCIGELLPLATVTREDNQRDCRFRRRFVGGFSVIVSLVFDNGAEWVAILPQFPKHLRCGRRRGGS